MVSRPACKFQFFKNKDRLREQFPCNVSVSPEIADRIEIDLESENTRFHTDSHGVTAGDIRISIKI